MPAEGCGSNGAIAAWALLSHTQHGMEPIRVFQHANSPQATKHTRARSHTKHTRLQNLANGYTHMQPFRFPLTRTHAHAHLSPPQQGMELLEANSVFEHAIMRNQVLDGDGYILHVRV